MARKRISKLQRRKISIFFKCLAISSIAWSLFAISSTYDFQQIASVNYINLPEGKAFHPLQSDIVKVRLRMSGWDVLMKRIYPDTTRLQVDLSNLKSKNFIVFSNQIGLVNKQFGVEVQAVSVAPDTLYFDFSKQTQKKVPIKPIYGLKFKNQYGIIGDIKTVPDHVTLTGPIEDVQDITYIETDSIIGKDVDRDIRTASYLNKNGRNNITIFPHLAEVTIPVGELTEKVAEVPIHIENASNYTSVRILPSKVKITYLVSLQDYQNWSSRDFEAVADLSLWVDQKVSSLPILLTQFPPYCKILNIEPQNVDFFVRK